MKHLNFKLAAIFICAVAFANAQVVTTIAGTTTAGSANGTGTGASFHKPAGIEIDGSGNLYVADDSNHEIRKIVISTGVVSTLAGSTTPGSANGTGAAASFNGPTGLAIDGSGNLYVADRSNHLIRKIVISTGVVTTIAGSGIAGSADGTGAAASFNFPSGVAADGSGNLYVADMLNNEIRKIVISTGVVSTLAGTTTFGSANGTGAAAGFYYPSGVAVDGSGNLYVTDYFNNEIRKIVISTGVVTTLAGTITAGFADGTGAAASFKNPAGITTDGIGNLYIGDQGNNEVRKVVLSTGVVTTLAGTTTAGSADGSGVTASFKAPTGVRPDGSGNLYVGDQDNNEIRKVTISPTGIVQYSISNTQLSIYPNPFTSQTTITFSEEQNHSVIKIMDVAGKEVKVMDFTGKQLTLEKGEMKTGVYFVQVIDGNNNGVNKKIVIQ